MTRFARRVSVFLILAFLVFGGPFPASAQEAAPAENTDAAYAAMLEQAQAMPADFDFAKVRDLYTKTSFFNPYGTDPKTDYKKFFDRQDAGDTTVLKDVEQYAKTHFALPEAQSRAMDMYEKAGDKNTAAYHEWALRGLIDAIWHSGDGKSAQSAIHVVNVSEEYMIMRGRKYEVGGQSLANENGRVYDVLNGTNKETGEIVKVWFDITPVFTAPMP